MARKTRIMLIVFLVGFTGGCASVSEMLPWKGKEAEEKKLVEMYLKKGQDSEQQGDLMEAIKQYKLALTQDPENQEAFESKNRVETKIRVVAERHYQKGLKYHRTGKYGLARREFLAALDFWPDHEQARKMFDTRREIRVEGYVLHTIKPGESLSKLAQIYYGDYHKFPFIAEFNKFTDATKVKVGQKIKVPKIEGIPFFPKKQEVDKEMEEVKSPAVALPPEKEVSEAKSPAAALSPEKETKHAETIEDKTDEGHQEPDDTLAMHRNLGIDLFNKKKYKQAIIELNKVVNVDPNDRISFEYLYKSHFQQGMDLFNQKDYLPAKKEFEAALRYWGNCEHCLEYARKSEAIYKDIHYNKGVSHFKNENLSEAIVEWELVMAVDRDYKYVEYNITKAKALLKKLEKIRKRQ
jgi:tetratricopeptide (TPR) repeat protein